MQENSEHSEILTGVEQLGPFPMERLKQVEQPTTRITDNIQRFDEREHGFNRAQRGDFGPLVARENQLFVMKYPIGAAELDMVRHFVPVRDGEVASQKAPIPDNPAILSRHIKRLGYFLRADVVGICRLPQYAVYSHDKNGNPIELDHQFAVVIAVDQDYETMNASTGNDWINCSQAQLSYSNTAFIACTMANYIRRLGYPARAHFADGNSEVVIPPLLLLAGIGEMCRIGTSVLNPFLGSRFKAAVVTTDLPLAPDKSIDFGLQEFCQKCRRCAVECPSRAISMGDKVMYHGYEVWKLDIEKCTKMMTTNPNGSSCGHCIKVCPWNKPKGWIHDRVRWLVLHTPWLDKFLIKMDSIWGYGKQHKENKWWFDLEEVNGVLQIPRRK